MGVAYKYGSPDETLPPLRQQMPTSLGALSGKWDGAVLDGVRDSPCAQGSAGADSGAKCGPSIRCSVHDLSPQMLGREGERIAASYLRRRGWEVVERNWVCPFGEADIIAIDDDTYVLIEVKTRTVASERYVSYPELAVGPAKQQRYRKIAECYMSENGLPYVRFDIVAVTIVAERTAHIHHLVAPFGSDA